MEKQQLEEIKAIILEKIKETETTIEEYREMTKPIAPENAIGRVSRMDAINNKSMAEAALQNSESKLAKLKNVLTLIYEKDFGICARCRQSIPLGRILKVPHSRFCVKCAK